MSLQHAPSLALSATHRKLCVLWSLGRSTAAWLAQLGERRSTEREVAGSNPGRTNTQGL